VKLSVEVKNGAFSMIPKANDKCMQWEQPSPWPQKAQMSI